MADGLTTEQILAGNPLPRFVLAVLADEARRGHVERHDGRWRARDEFVGRYGQDFSWLPRPTSKRRSET